MSAATTKQAGSLVQTLKSQLDIAQAALDKLFTNWDKERILPRIKLQKKTKTELLDIIDELRKSTIPKAKRPPVKEAARILLTNPGCQRLSYVDLAKIIKQAYLSRNLACKTTAGSLQWYPSQLGFIALPRIKLSVDDFER
jgi:hypothetical protein